MIPQAHSDNEMRPKRIRAVTFDAGFTLIHTRNRVGEIYAAALHRRSHSADSDKIEARFKKVFAALKPKGDTVITNETEKEMWRDIVRLALHNDCPENDFEGVFEELYDEFARGETWRLEPGAKDVLEELSRRGYRLMLISNADSRFRRVLEELNLRHCFEKLFISAEVGLEKPDIRLFNLVREHLQLSPDSILHVGDSPFHDGNGAKVAGWHYRILSRDGKTINGHPAIASLHDLLSLLPPL